MSPERLKQEKTFALVRIFSGIVVFLMLGYSFLVNFFSSGDTPPGFPVFLTGLLSLAGLGFSLHHAKKLAALTGESTS